MKTFQLAIAAMAAIATAACSENGNLPTESVMEQASAQQSETRGANLVQVALSVNAATGEFSTLIAALQAAGLVEAIAAPGQRTVFAPTDAAFAALGLDAQNIGTLDRNTLTQILLYHVTPGRRDAASVVGATRIRMLNGGFTRITVNSSGAFINDSRIVQTDVGASNGTIHVIDAVLLP